MKELRLMNQTADYKKLGISSQKIELWEDGRRDKAIKGHWEWWYFDAMLDDGSQLVIQFFPKLPRSKGAEDHPAYHYTLTLPDGRKLDKTSKYSNDEVHFGTNYCDVIYGKSQIIGDFKKYHIIADPDDTNDGFGADIQLNSVSTPYRPGTGYFGYDDDSNYYTWLCAVPRGEVNGTVTYDGKAHQVHGWGYHDHQWGSKSYLSLWNNWTWARQSFGDYSLLVFDMVSTEAYGHKRFPIVFLQDQNGKLIFNGDGNLDYQLLDKFTDDMTGKHYPRNQLFIFSDGDKKLEYTLTANKVIENETMNDKMPKSVLKLMKLKGINVSYMRYTATGDMKLTIPGEPALKRTDELIYEFMYPGAKNFDELI